MLSTTEKAKVLSSVPFLAGIPDHALMQVAALLEEIHVEAGQEVVRKGDHGESMYIIASGRMRVHDGEQTLNYLGAGEPFGEMAALDPEPRSASVTAVEDTRLLSLSRRRLFELMDNQPEVAHGLIRVISQRLRARTRDLNELRTHMERVVLPLGIALSTERSLDRLLERIMLEAKSFCNADASTLYLLTEDARLRFAMMRTDSLGFALGGTTGREIPFPPLPLYDEETGEPSHRYVATHVALSGQSINIPDIDRAQEFDWSATREFDKRSGYHSVSNLTVPLKNHEDQVIGVLQLINALDRATGMVIPFDPYQQLVVESLASQAAVALNTQMLLRRQQELLRFEHDLQVGRRIQTAFLPDEATLPQPPGWEIATRFHPAREVAGDFYDVFLLPHGTVGLAIGDVCDKGVGSALFMTLSRSLLRAFASQAHLRSGQDGLSVDEDAEGHAGRQGTLSGSIGALRAVEQTSDYILENHFQMNMFATLFFGVLDPVTGLLAYVNAGHDPPFIVSSDGTVKTRLGPTGPAVGLWPDMSFDIAQVRLQPGDLLLMVTDGVTDARSPDREYFSVERLLSVLAQPFPSAVALLDRVEADLRSHMAEAVQFDDITMLAAWRLPVTEARS